ncbi:glycosyltransferase family 2 protein [Chryseolinea sp. Jin1]|uniref:Glycosyltransferase family 2 protein n=2 Tax=Chryseolinea lacunae TaxID=2801331 RepID=A0ABS1KNR8_9BACT|nr:glycosyltransferase family 2 protein [Chryseolinea lacunae]
MISVVIPVFNEGSNVRKIYSELLRVMGTLKYDYEVIFVDDGSRDNSLEMVHEIAAEQPNIYYIEFSRNFGHQYALKAGMDVARGNCVITLDCDLQHPPDLIPKLVKLWEDGFDVVYTIREDDPSLSLFKRKSSTYFYTVMNKLSNMDIEKGAADFRLMDRSVVDVFTKFGESDLFIRGLVKWMGFKQTSVRYFPHPRFSGKSKYSLARMLTFAFKGITSFSTKPLIVTGYLGIIFFLISLIYLPYALISYFTGQAVSGWTSIIMTVIFFGGLQLLMLGIIGLYLGRVVVQGKGRPHYVIRTTNHPAVVKANYAYTEG